jgi:hypothetical protein
MILDKNLEMDHLDPLIEQQEKEQTLNVQLRL